MAKGFSKIKPSTRSGIRKRVNKARVKHASSRTTRGKVEKTQHVRWTVIEYSKADADAFQKEQSNRGWKSIKVTKEQGSALSEHGAKPFYVIKMSTDPEEKF